MGSTILAKTTPADLQKLLPADAVVVDFLRSILWEQDKKWTVRYAAFLTTKEKVSWIDLGLAPPIEDTVTAWRKAITGGKVIPPDLPQKVRDLVWAKVRKEIPRGVRMVYIAPDSALCRVPWAALPGDKPKTILLEDF